jgi:hypothetical protein
VDELVGDRDVMLHGANSAQECLRGGALDEMEIHLAPVLLGAGRRRFDGLGPSTSSSTTSALRRHPDMLHLRCRVRFPTSRLTIIDGAPATTEGVMPAAITAQHPATDPAVPPQTPRSVSVVAVLLDGEPRGSVPVTSAWLLVDLAVPDVPS